MKQWIPCVVFYFYIFIIRLIPSSLSVYLIEDYSLNATQLGEVGSIGVFIYSILQIPVGFLLDRYSVQKIILSSIVLLILSLLLLGVGHSKLSLLVARAFAGAGSVAGFLAASKVTASIFPASRVPFMLGCTLTVGTLGAVFGGQMLIFLAKIYQWRFVVLSLALIGIALLIWVGLVVKINSKSLQKLSSNAFDWRSSILWKNCFSALALYVPICVFCDNWGVPFLVRHAIGQSTAVRMVSEVYIGLALGCPLLAFVAKKTLHFEKLIHLSALGMFFLFSFILYVHNFWINFALLGAGILAGAEMLCFSRAVQSISSHHAGLQTAIINTVVMGAAAIAQMLIGVLLDSFFLESPFATGVQRYSVFGFRFALQLMLVVSFVFQLFSLRIKTSDLDKA